MLILQDDQDLSVGTFSSPKTQIFEVKIQGIVAGNNEDFNYRSV
jgi:hypothetical protein